MKKPSSQSTLRIRMTDEGPPTHSHLVINVVGEMTF